MRTLKILFAIVLGLLAVGATRVGATLDDVNRASLALYVNVEQGGNPVGGLTAGNFRVFLNGKTQPFDLVPAEMPALIVVLADREAAAQMAAGFGKYSPPGNWYALGVFDRDTHILADFTKDKSRILSGLGALPLASFDGTATYDAVWDMVDILSQLPGRRVLIFAGSGMDNFSRHSFGDVERKLEASDVTVFSLGFEAEYRFNSVAADFSVDLERLQARSFVRMLAETSGGEAWFPQVEPAFSAAFGQAMQNLSMEYKLVLTPSATIENRFYETKVEAFTIANDKRTNFNVRVRRGFRPSIAP